MNKKFIASVLAVSMLMGLSVPAMADDGEVAIDGKSLSFSVSGDSIIQEPNVSLTFSVDEGFIINPFKVDLSDDVKGDSGITGTVSGQIAGRVHEVTNNGDVAVAIDITNFVADPVGDKGKYNETDKGYPITIASSSPAKAKEWTKSKTAYIYLQFATDSKNLASEDKKNMAKAVQARGKDGKAIDAEKKGGKKLKAMEIDKNKTCYYQLKGDVNENPKVLGKSKDHDSWGADDKINVSYKVVITPKKN
jgi:hypothetical protein